MKATELMIGDYIMFDGSPYIIEEISAKGWIHIIDTKNKIRVALSTDYILNFIEGIPLTPDILKNNRFKIISEDVYRISNDLFVLTDDSPYSLCNSFDIGYGDEYNYITSIKYVHELQHTLKLVRVKKEIEL